jgi:hypothetical protein
MGHDYKKNLNPQKALIWRIVHRDNIPWVLENGMHCGNSSQLSSNWVHIGNLELIDKRSTHPVPVGMGGYLNDYVPFYFTPFSPMMKNISSGYGGIVRRSNDEIVILVSNLHLVQKLGLPFVFTNGHAYYAWSNFYTDLSDLSEIDWPLLQTRNFRRDPDDPAKFERYQAEALIYRQFPIQAIAGIVCYTEKTKLILERWLTERDLDLPVYARTGWYF